MLSYENLSFSLSIGAFAGIYKFILCLLRRLRNKDDAKNTFIASTIASVSILFDINRTWRRTYLYLFLCRALDCLKNIMNNKTRFKKIPYFEIILMCLIGFGMWSFFTSDYKLVGDEIIGIFDKMAHTKLNEWSLMRCIYQRPLWSTPFK